MRVLFPVRHFNWLLLDCLLSATRGIYAEESCVLKRLNLFRRQIWPVILLQS